MLHSEAEELTVPVTGQALATELEVRTRLATEVVEVCHISTECQAAVSFLDEAGQLFKLFQEPHTLPPMTVTIRRLNELAKSFKHKVVIA